MMMAVSSPAVQCLKFDRDDASFFPAFFAQLMHSDFVIFSYVGRAYVLCGCGCSDLTFKLLCTLYLLPLYCQLFLYRVDRLFSSWLAVYLSNQTTTDPLFVSSVTANTVLFISPPIVCVLDTVDKMTLKNIGTFGLAD